MDPLLKSNRRRVYVSYLLRLLGMASMVTLAVALRPLSSRKAVRSISQTARFESWRLKQALHRLEKRGLVRRRKRDDGNEYLLLTKAGEAAFLQEKHRTLILQKPAKWDGQWRIVMFDIKEDKKNIRDAIRRHLRRLGFYRLQKSVFVTPNPCESEIHFLQKFYESEGEICLITATFLGEKERAVRKYFGRIRRYE